MRSPTVRPSFRPFFTAALALTAATVATFGASGAARAQAEAAGGTGYTETRGVSGSDVVFKEDHATGSNTQPMGGLVRSGLTVLRPLLIRPRLNFVPEMLKSVESM
jgi:hypothetical protein